jgi:imidazolonepropionase-like amidohydrolase
MQPQFENIAQTETGIRNLLEATYKGTKLEVVTGYDITHDNWPFHVFVTAAGGQKERLSVVPTPFRCDTMKAAFEQGKAMAAQWHDRKSEGGFQREIKAGPCPF